MNEKFNKNAKVEKITTMLGKAVRLIVIDPSCRISLNKSYSCQFGLKLIHMNQKYIFHFSSPIVSKIQ